jgi:heme exporter protein D
MRTDNLFKAIAIFGVVSIFTLILSGVLYIFFEDFYPKVIGSIAELSVAGIFLVGILGSVLAIISFDELTFDSLFLSWKNFILSVLGFLVFLPVCYSMVSLTIVEIFELIPFYRHPGQRIDLAEMRNYNQYVWILAGKMYLGVTILAIVLRKIRIKLEVKRKLSLN